ncbi:MAG TPA: hypothetical protein VHF50_03710 [Solirubrobacterales bacterium]|nr:hypothetical protein [Solirubrobacterales bacterium]
MLELSAEALREVLLARHDEESGTSRLWLRRVKVIGAFDLEAAHLKPRLRFENCEFPDLVNLAQMRGSALAFTGCRLSRRLHADQLSLSWNLELDRSRLQSGASIAGASIGGFLSLRRSTLQGGATAQPPRPALAVDVTEVGGDVYCGGLHCEGGARFMGAKIGGQLQLNEATFKAQLGDEPAKLPALGADRIQVGGTFFCGSGFEAVGEVRLMGAKVGGQLMLTEATLKATLREDGKLRPALAADAMEIGGDMYCGGISTEGEVRILGAKIGGQLNLHDANLRELDGPDGSPRPSFIADGAEIAGDLYGLNLSSQGEVRMLGAKVGGQMMLNGAKLEISPSPLASRSALDADGVEVSESLFCGDGFVAKGKVRLLGARVGGQLRLVDATLVSQDPSVSALDGDNLTVRGDMLCRGLVAHGPMRLPAARIEGQLSLAETVLRSEAAAPYALNLVAARVDELILAFAEIEGLVDLRNANVRSFWDAVDGGFAGQQPERLRLDGFRYEWLREPLDAASRLRWIAPSQAERHFPGVYAELAEAFRRVGHRGDARKVGIANERRARQDLPRLSPRKLWHDFLWLTVGYGYRNWLALFWVLGVIALGAALFALNEGSFIRTSSDAPPLEPVLYAIDTAVPVLQLGQTRTLAATDCMAWVEMGVALAGYALVAAVVAAAAGVFNRDQV